MKIGICLLLLLVWVSEGCTMRQERMIETLKAQETITIEELTLLARTEELKFAKPVLWQPEGATVPVTVLTADNGQILLIWDTQNVPDGRTAIEQAGWTAKNWWPTEPKPPIVEQALAQFGEETRQYYCSAFTAKNLLVYALVPQTLAVEYHLDKTVQPIRSDFQKNLLTKLRAIFWWDINHMIGVRYQAANAHYAIEIELRYYSTAFTENGQTRYDNTVAYTIYFRPLNGEIYRPDEPITVTVQDLLNGQTATVSAALTQWSPETYWMLVWGPVMSVTPTPLIKNETPSVTVTIGDVTETLPLTELYW